MQGEKEKIEPFVKYAYALHNTRALLCHLFSTLDKRHTTLIYIISFIIIYDNETDFTSILSVLSQCHCKETSLYIVIHLEYFHKSRITYGCVGGDVKI